MIASLQMANMHRAQIQSPDRPPFPAAASRVYEFARVIGCKFMPQNLRDLLFPPHSDTSLMPLFPYLLPVSDKSRVVSSDEIFVRIYQRKLKLHSYESTE